LRQAAGVTFILAFTPIGAAAGPEQQSFVDLLALMSGSCKTLTIAGHSFACKTVAYAHTDNGRVIFAVAVDDPNDNSRIISFSGKNGKRADDNSYELPIDRVLLNSNDRPKVDGLPAPIELPTVSAARPATLLPKK
jgi:hypothetical protein